jgi:hypothetical protein
MNSDPPSEQVRQRKIHRETGEQSAQPNPAMDPYGHGGFSRRQPAVTDSEFLSK